MPRDVWETGKPSEEYTPTLGPVTISRPEPSPPRRGGGGADVMPATTFIPPSEPSPPRRGGGGAGLPTDIFTNIPPVIQPPSQAIEDEYDVPDPEHEAWQRKEEKRLIDKMGDKYAATPGPAEGKGIDDVIKDTVIKGKEKVTDLWSQLPSIQMLKGITSLFNKAPTVAQLQDPNFLAIMNEVFKNDPTRRDKYVEDYKDEIAKSIGLWGEDGEYYHTRDDFFAEKDAITVDDMEDGMSLKDEFKRILSTAKYEPGSEAERRIDPESYYDQPERDPEGKFFQPVSSRFANTIGNLEDIAGIAITDDMSGPFRQQIFDARAELDRQQGAGGGGGGAGIPSIYKAGPNIGMGQYSNIPEQYQGFFDSPFNKPVAGGMAMTPVQLPDGSIIEFGDTGSAGQFQQYLDSIDVNWSRPGTVQPVTPTPTPAATPAATAPTPFDYSPWPQFGPAGGPVPNYVNQGLGQGPHFDYWNQIARTFPGMT